VSAPSTTLIHFAKGNLTPACRDHGDEITTSTRHGEVTCFACRKSAAFLEYPKGVGTPTPLDQVIAESPEMQELSARALAALWRNERGMYTVEETIHHGDYRSTRRVEVYDITPSTVDGILMSSAYCYGSWARADAPYAEHRAAVLKALVKDLRSGIENRSVGWSTFRLTK
jgi:hypothetical protein